MKHSSLVCFRVNTRRATGFPGPEACPLSAAPHWPACAPTRWVRAQLWALIGRSRTNSQLLSSSQGSAENRASSGAGGSALVVLLVLLVLVVLVVLLVWLGPAALCSFPLIHSTAPLGWLHTEQHPLLVGRLHNTLVWFSERRSSKTIKPWKHIDNLTDNMTNVSV